MTDEDFKYYFNFIANALRGNNPSAVDSFFKQHHRSIEGVAAQLREQIHTPVKKLYRGVLLEDKYVRNNSLTPLSHITYLSFSEDKHAADEFADPRSPMGSFFMKQTPGAKGYMIEHRPSPQEILFHWTWAKPLGLHKIPQLDMHVIVQQKEVMLKQIGKKFKLLPYSVTSGLDMQLAHFGYEIRKGVITQAGVYDPYIFKAIHFVGGGGSGKSFVYKHLFEGIGLKHVNSDSILERLARENDIDLSKDLYSPVIQDPDTGLRAKAKQLSSKREVQAINQRLGIVIEGTGIDPAKMLRRYRLTKNIGYDNYLVFVNTNLEVAQQRAKQRGDSGGRRLEPDAVEQMWRQAQTNIGKYQELFGRNNMLIIDNSVAATEKEIATDLGPKLRRTALHFLAQPIKNKKAIKWLRYELASKGLSKSNIKTELRKITKR